MKAIVEWGTPKHATNRKICGISGQFIVANPSQACMLASQLFHSLTQGTEHVLNNKGAWGVTKETPRKVIWSQDSSVWVCVSLLDGVARGAYAGKADSDAAERLHTKSEGSAR